MRISEVFGPDHRVLIPYVTCGYPTIDATVEVTRILAESGADIVELGIPFSDPLADGATIQKASFQALHNGVTATICLDAVRTIRKTTGIPIVFMSYYNPIFSYGETRFVDDCADVGVSGLIIPDLPPEEGHRLEVAARSRGIDIIYLLAPTSPGQRIRTVASHSGGFVYLVSVSGVTGARENLPSNLQSFVGKVRSFAKQPLCVGFGISTPQQAREVAKYADGVIVGSKLVQLMESQEWKKDVKRFAEELRAALDSTTR